mgnify:CR=1 FL=1
MPAITIMDVPDPIHRAIVRLARRNRRSLERQALLLLERARYLDGSSPLDRAAAIRGRLERRDPGHTVAGIRVGRGR